MPRSCNLDSERQSQSSRGHNLARLGRLWLGVGAASLLVGILAVGAGTFVGNLFPQGGRAHELSPPLLGIAIAVVSGILLAWLLASASLQSSHRSDAAKPDTCAPEADARKPGHLGPTVEVGTKVEVYNGAYYGERYNN